MPVWWQQLLLVGAGGALGGALRHIISSAFVSRIGDGARWGTLTVNTSGAFALGCWIGASAAGGIALDRAWLLLGVGVLGSYTTVSTLALQVLWLAQDRRQRAATAYVALTLGAGLAAGGCGWLLARLA